MSHRQRSVFAAALLTVSACSFDGPPLPSTDAPPLVDAPRTPDAAPVDGAPDRCEGFVDGYRVENAPLSWPAASAACGFAGGYLAVIGSPAENATVRALIPTTTRFWLGMGDGLSEGVWLWLDGSLVDRDPARWDPNQPNDSQANGGEDCGEMSNSGTWNDDNCNAMQPFVCECDP